MITKNICGAARPMAPRRTMNTPIANAPIFIIALMSVGGMPGLIVRHSYEITSKSSDSFQAQPAAPILTVYSSAQVRAFSLYSRSRWECLSQLIPMGHLRASSGGAVQEVLCDLELTAFLTELPARY